MGRPACKGYTKGAGPCQHTECVLLGACGLRDVILKCPSCGNLSATPGCGVCATLDAIAELSKPEPRKGKSA